MVSRLIDDGPDMVTVFPEVAATDEDGNPIRVAGDPGIDVFTHVQPVEASENDGVTTTRVRWSTSRLLPIGADARAKFADMEWAIIGTPVRLGRSERTAKTTVVMEALRPWPLPGA